MKNETDNKIIQEATEAVANGLDAGYAVGRLLAIINRQKAEIERLQKEKFDSLNCQFAEMYATTLKIATKKAKSEAIKEFAERLKALPSVMNCEYEWLHIDIDNLVKEITEQTTFEKVEHNSLCETETYESR